LFCQADCRLTWCCLSKQAELLTQTQQQAEQLAIALQNLKQTQTQLIQTEKMSSLGQLVAGVAHEINNPVNFIYGNLAYTRQYAQDLLNLLHLYQKLTPMQSRRLLSRQRTIELDFSRRRSTENSSFSENRR
jgi:C4-dicarboxylate-specific signal transduction histidine kinase